MKDFAPKLVPFAQWVAVMARMVSLQAEATRSTREAVFERLQGGMSRFVSERYPGEDNDPVVLLQAVTAEWERGAK